MKQTTKWLAAALIALGLNQAAWADDVSDFRETLQAAERGNAAAQNNLGSMYYKGRGVRQDDAEAVKWFRQAAERGDAQAQFNLGIMYDIGRGVSRDDAEAVKWYRQAAERGVADAQFNLGNMYYEGRGVRQDDAEAFKWYRQAAAQGDVQAQFNLGRMYENGRGVRQDDAEAVRWYRQAAAQGDAKAQYNLGVMYANGQGVRQNYKIAGDIPPMHPKQNSIRYIESQGVDALDGPAAAADFGRRYAAVAATGAVPVLSEAMLEAFNRQNARSQAALSAATKARKEWVGKACDNGLQLGCDAYQELNQQGY
nr:tetratricopeptide repeat protein [uncultured Neisseria sp.]